MCGIAGLIDFTKENIIEDLYEAIFHLQHRGQDSCGISTADKKLYTIKGQGLVRYVFSEDKLMKLRGFLGLGHVRYPTTGNITYNEIQPFYLNRPYGISIVHNGNIYNFMELKEYLEDKDIHLNSTSDSELLLNLISYELELNTKHMNLEDNLHFVIKKISMMCKGAYSVILMIQNYGLIAFRDIHGIRPLIYGKKGNKYLISSESICQQSLEYNELKNVENGEMIIFRKDGFIKKIKYEENSVYTPCIFEYIYISRCESVIDKVSVYLARVKMGKYLAYNLKESLGDKLNDIDFVVPIPDTSRPSAIVVSKILNIPYYEIITKNRYVSRTFIMDSEKRRRISVKRKLGIVDGLAEGKNILLIDDSIVRGNTIKHVIERLKKYKINKIYVASCSPPIRYKNVYGIDIPTREELIANKMSIKDIKEYLGIDGLFFQKTEDLIRAIQDINPELKNFDLSVFNGEYII
jgi:amidophosphoribosyltransferase